MKNDYTNAPGTPGEYDADYADDVTEPVQVQSHSANVREVHNGDPSAEVDTTYWQEDPETDNPEYQAPVEGGPSDPSEEDEDTDPPEDVEEDIPASDETEAEEPDPLMDIAVDIGLDKQYAAKLAKAGLLAETVRMELRRTRSREQDGEESPSAAETPAPEDANAWLKELGLTEDEFDPAIIKAFETLNTRYTNELRQLQQANDAQQRKQYYSWFDDKIAGLGDEFSEVLGKGRGDELKQDTPEFQNRVKLLEEMEALKAGYEVQNRSYTYDQLFQQALRAVHGDKLTAIERGKLKGAMSTRSKQRTARPTKRSSSSVSGTTSQKNAKLVTALSQKLRELGLDEDAYGTVENP